VFPGNQPQITGAALNLTLPQSLHSTSSKKARRLGMCVEASS